MFLIAVRADNVVLQIRTALEDGNIPFEQSQHIIPGDKGRFYVQIFLLSPLLRSLPSPSLSNEKNYFQGEMRVAKQNIPRNS